MKFVYLYKVFLSDGSIAWLGKNCAGNIQAEALIDPWGSQLYSYAKENGWGSEKEAAGANVAIYGRFFDKDAVASIIKLPV
jgi:hypothetical protein